MSEDYTIKDVNNKENNVILLAEQKRKNSNKTHSIKSASSYNKVVGENFDFNNGKKGSGGGGGMDDLNFRVNRLEEKLSDLQTELSKKPSTEKIELMQSELKNFISEKFEKVPNEDRIKIIISEELTSKSITDSTKLKNEINKATLKMIFWMIGTALTVSSIACTIVIGLLRIFPLGK